MNEVLFVNDLKGDPKTPWTPLEFRVKRGQVHEWQGWMAALVRELLVRHAAMSIEGAQVFLQVKNFKITKIEILSFLTTLTEKKFIRTFLEEDIKTKQQNTKYIRSQDHWDTKEIIHIPEGAKIQMAEAR